MTCHRLPRPAHTSMKRARIVSGLPRSTPFASTIPPSTAPSDHALRTCLIATYVVLLPGKIASAMDSALFRFLPFESASVCNRRRDTARALRGRISAVRCHRRSPRRRDRQSDHDSRRRPAPHARAASQCPDDDPDRCSHLLLQVSKSERVFSAPSSPAITCEVKSRVDRDAAFPTRSKGCSRRLQMPNWS